MKHQINIIEIAHSRWDEYRQLRLKSLLEIPYAYGSSYEEEINLTREDWVKRLKNSYTLFAEDNGKLIGVMVLLRYTSKNINHIAELVSVYVDNDYQNMGIGKLLLEHILSKAKELGIEKVELNVVTTQVAAKKLYTSAGFIEVGIQKKALKIKDYYYDEILMEKLLS